MPSLRDIRRRIKSVKNTEKITKAMELVSAAKLRRAQDRMLQARPYADEITGVMAELMRRTPEYKHPFLVKREVKRRTIILVTADRGQVGAMNSSAVRFAVRESQGASVPVSFVTIGRKGRDSIRRLRCDLIGDVSQYGDRPRVRDLLPAVQVAMQQYEAAEADQVDVIYTRFISISRQQATVQRLLPVEPPVDAPPASADFLYEPEPKDVLDALLPRYVESQIYRAVLENVASEQAARMQAMHNASDNARELITDLSLTANQVRQSTITTELMEIVGGVAALEG
ncbi:MAG: ATP synthase F1 subunit gamma [Candidatus Dormibacteria bacterium]